MKDDRWQRAKEIFDEARGLAPELRASFIDTACSGDKELQAEVEILLTSYQTDFMEDTALVAADLLIEPGLIAGQVIGRYRIGDLIGTGGMGQVFRAEDTELERPVAFKVLHGDIAENDERVRRFIQEAKAASALNHPNILTIYEIGSFEGLRYIVSEYIDGDTLRDRMRDGLTVSESLDITSQIAAALKAAHSAGIVHRDIKPENVMLRPDGLVKVLDFGLAKLTENRPGDAETQRRSEEDNPLIAVSPRPGVPVSPNTQPGLIMGTVAYMSPEQARGQAVDSRTDLWSLGVVFHEMLTGESPFKGESVTDLVTSILKHDPASLDLESISQELKPICTKALAKDKKARYQTAQDLLQDLQGEKKRMEYAIQGTPFVTVSSTDELKTQLIRRRPTLSAEYIVTSVKRHKLATLTALTLVTFLGVGLSVYRYNAAPANTMHGAIDAETTEKDLKISRVAASGQVFDIAISPDGKFVAYTTGEPRRISIHVKELASQRDTEIVPASTAEKSNVDRLIFTPDSQNLLYQYGTPYNEEIFRVPVNGGTPVKIADNTNSLAVSPDGKLMALHKDLDENGKNWKGYDLVVSKVDGSDERVLERTLDGKDDLADCPIPAWSTDSKWIACPFRHGKFNEGYAQMYAINVADGTTRPMSDQKWVTISGVVWMPDNTLVISAKEKSNEPSQLWRVSDSEAKQITVDAVGYTDLSATRDGKTLVTVQAKYRSDLWVSPGNDPSHAVQLTSSGEMRNFYPLPDRKVVFTSEITDPPQLWLLNRDGTDRRQLTFGDTRIAAPLVTPDGKFIVYGSQRDDGFHILRMNVDGSDQRELTSTTGLLIRSSPDSKWIYFYSRKRENGTNQIYKMSIDGGSPTVIARVKVDGGIDISSRDEIAAIVTNSEFVTTGINVFDKRGKLLKTIPVTPTVSNVDVALKWTPDGRRIAFLDVSNGAMNIWAVSADGKGRPRPLTNFTSPGVVTFKWPYEGKELFIMRRESTSDAMMITNKGN